MENTNERDSLSLIGFQLYEWRFPLFALVLGLALMIMGGYGLFVTGSMGFVEALSSMFIPGIGMLGIAAKGLKDKSFLGFR